MRKQLLLSTAALLASVALASAQHAPSGHSQTSAGAAQEHQQSAQGHAGQAQQGAVKEQSREGRQAQGSERERTTGQATQERKSGQSAQERERSSGKAAQEHERTTGKAAEEKGKAQREQDMQGKAQREANPQERTTGQGQREAQQPAQERQTQQPAQTQQRQAQQPKQGQTQTQAGRQGQAQPHQAQLEGGKSLSSEQQSRISRTVVASRDIPRANNATFSLAVGTMVPTSVHIVAVPQTLIEIYPAWRDDECFVAGDDFVIVDHSHKIVAVVPVGSEGGARYSSSEGYSSSSMSREEIRELQMALRDKGFAVEVDGVWGPRTREVLVQFQQRQGLQGKGEIDQQTMSALGINARGQGQPSSSGQSQPSSTGQAGGKMQQPSAGTSTNQPSRAQLSTSGQSAPSMQQPSTHPGAGTSSPNAGATQGMSPSGNAPRTEQGR